MPIQGLSRFAGQVVLVTGAASGIGLATARRFVQEGASVIFADRDKNALDGAISGLNPLHAVTSLTDISAPLQVEAMIETIIARFGRLDVVVNNAGVTTPGTVLDSGLDAWLKVCSTTLTGTIDVSRSALPHLIETRGCIVNTASVSGTGGDWNTAYYDAAKGGVVSLTRAMALDHGRSGVRVNAICPSVTHTGMTADMLKKNPEFVKKFEDRSPLGRVGQPEDMAAAILFLASADAAYITGVMLPVDGGISASNGQPAFPA